MHLNTDGPFQCIFPNNYNSKSFRNRNLKSGNWFKNCDFLNVLVLKNCEELALVEIHEQKETKKQILKNSDIYPKIGHPKKTRV